MTVLSNIKFTSIAIGICFILYIALSIMGYVELADRIGWRLLAPIPLWYLIAVLSGMIAEANR